MCVCHFSVGARTGTIILYLLFSPRRDGPSLISIHHTGAFGVRTNCPRFVTVCVLCAVCGSVVPPTGAWVTEKSRTWPPAPRRTLMVLRTPIVPATAARRWRPFCRAVKIAAPRSCERLPKITNAAIIGSRRVARLVTRKFPSIFSCLRRAVFWRPSRGRNRRE